MALPKDLQEALDKAYPELEKIMSIPPGMAVICPEPSCGHYYHRVRKACPRCGCEARPFDVSTIVDGGSRSPHVVISRVVVGLDIEIGKIIGTIVMPVNKLGKQRDLIKIEVKP